MSVRVMSWVWQHSKAEGNARLVLLAIADRADDEGGNAYPAVKTIAEKCRLSERTVQRAIQELELLGDLVVNRRAAPLRGDKRTNVYQVVMERGDNLTPRSSERGDRTGARGDKRPGETPRGVTAVSPDTSFDSSIETRLDPVDIERNLAEVAKLKAKLRGEEVA